MRLIPRRFDFDDIFDSFIPTTEMNMKCDIFEKDGDYHIEMDIPGFDKQDITIDVKNGYLNISAEKTDEETKEEKKYIKRERVYGKYQRSFYIGDMDSNDIKAKFENGILKLTVPKKEKDENKNIVQIED